MRPNILFIMTDQQFADAMSCAGNKNLKTPAMDWLAGKGIRYEKAYCSNPICVPSRTSMFTGMLGHKTGVDMNIDDLPKAKLTSIGAVLKQAGYDTGYVGKWHIPIPLQDKEWSGFDFQFHDTKETNDSDFAAPCIDFINTKREKPFFLVASFNNPHDICQYARNSSGIECAYPNEGPGDVPAPVECPELPSNFELPDIEPGAFREHQACPTMRDVYPTRDWKNDKWRQYLWAYYRMIENVDREIKKVIDGLKESGQLENTVIVFTSDHGDGMGSHRWNQKTLFYEECVRIPFVISHPANLSSGKVDKKTLINTGIDIASLFCDIADIPVPAGLDGQQLYSLAKGTVVKTHDFIVSQTHLHNAYGIRGDYNGRMLRTQKFKYIVFDGGKNPEQLFDMEEDLGEMKNLAYSPDFKKVIAKHRELLENWIRMEGDWFRMPQELTLIK